MNKVTTYRNGVMIFTAFLQGYGGPDAEHAWAIYNNKLLAKHVGDSIAVPMERWRAQRSGPLKGVEVCACVALRGSIGSRSSCSIYAKRPRVCDTAVKPGDRTCLQVRKLFNELLEETT